MRKTLIAGFVLTVAAVIYTIQIARAQPECLDAGFEFRIQVPAKRLVQVEANDSRSLVELWNAEGVDRRCHVLPGALSVFDVDYRQNVMLILVEGILKFQRETIRRIGIGPTGQA